MTADHWPGSLLGTAGRRTVSTPTLDHLARLGTVFDRAYSECPVCIPARRSLMTGTSPRTHGDREFKPAEPMPDIPTLAQAFSDSGYQAYAVGKLHVYPARNRIGFDDVLLMEEGRSQLGSVDDYEIFLGDFGHTGQQYAHGLSNNDYQARPWHLEERFHPTSWASQQMARLIRRRDPTRPAFWYLSYPGPHPPLTPPQPYLDMYREVAPDPPVAGDWSSSAGYLPYLLRAVRAQWPARAANEEVATRRAFYASCTYIDHQLRTVIGTLREEGVLEDTIILFTADHGDMLGDHGLWAKRLFYESSARVPMILVPATGDDRVPEGLVDSRLVCLRDVMPTLLDLANLPVPATVEGESLARAPRRQCLYGEFGTGVNATRMVVDGRFKLIYYAAGNHLQLFDLDDDPQETRDLADSPEHEKTVNRLTDCLVQEMYGSDAAFLDGCRLVGVGEPAALPPRERGLHGMRGIQWPPPPLDGDPERVVGAPL